MVNYEPGQDRNVAALSNLVMCDGFCKMNNIKEKYMRIALKEAKKTELFDEVPIGCVIVKDNKVISRGFNKRELKNDVTSHAEIEAIRRASKKLGDWQLIDCDLYVTIEPCLMCTGAIIQSRIKNVYYGSEDPKGGALVSSLNINEVKNLNHHINIEGGILKDECSNIVKQYFAKKRKYKTLG